MNNITQEDFDKLVKRYGDLKTQEKEVADELKTENERIKSLMYENHMVKYSFNGYTLTLYEKESVNFNSDKALTVLKDAYSEGCAFIKTVEVIDMDALEQAIYNNTIDVHTLVKLDECRTTNVTKILKCTKSKKEET